MRQWPERMRRADRVTTAFATLAGTGSTGRTEWRFSTLKVTVRDCEVVPEIWTGRQAAPDLIDWYGNEDGEKAL